MKKTRPPSEFLRVCKNFHADSLEMYPTTESMVDYAMEGIERNERPILIAYLEQLTSGKYTASDLEEIWNTSGADIYVTDGKYLKVFLEGLLARLRDDTTQKRDEGTMSKAHTR